MNDHDVEYVIVGAFAVARHGAPRFTGDLDIYVRPTDVNARAVVNALQGFGFGAVGLQTEDFLTPDRVIQPGYPPVRIGLLTSISGVSCEDAATGSVAGTYGDVPVRFLGLEQLIANKRATGRLKDKADLESLGVEP